MLLGAPFYICALLNKSVYKYPKFSSYLRGGCSSRTTQNSEEKGNKDTDAMSNLAHGPKVRPLSTKETISSIENWKSTVIYGLRLNPEFREFLADGFTWGKKSNTYPFRQLNDVYKKETITDKVEGKEIQREILVKTQTREERATLVDLLLDQISNYCPLIPRNDITKDSACLTDVWKKIRQYYNKESTGSLLNDVWNVCREIDEEPQALFGRMKQMYDDNLLTAYGIEHVDGALNVDEEMSPTLLNTVILHWLQVLHPDLRDLVTQRFVTELRTKTYAAIFPAISRSVKTFLDELNGNTTVNRAYHSYTPKVPQMNRSKSSYLPQTYKASSSYSPQNHKPNSNRYNQQRRKNCEFCKATGKRMYYTHSIDDCLFIKRLNESKTSYVKHTVCDEEADEIEHHYAEFYEEIEKEEHFIVEHIINRTNIDASPTLELFNKDQVCCITLDTGAPCNLIAERKALQMKATIKPTTRRVRMADGVSPLDVIGETEVTLFRKNKPYKLSAIVCRDTDTEILAGMPFMKQNDIAIRPFSDEIIIGGTEFIKYNPNGSTSTVRKVTVFSEKTQVILPGEKVSFTVPTLEGNVAIEPRWDSSHNKIHSEVTQWPLPQTNAVNEGKVTLQNTYSDPITLNKLEPICTLYPECSNFEPPNQPIDKNTLYTPQAEPKVCKNIKYTNAVNLNPDKLFNDSDSSKYKDLLLTYDHVFSPVNSTYNGYSGTCKVKINIGPNLPPQRKGHIPFYNDSDLRKLQDKFDELQAKGIFSRPQEVGIAVENINPSFLVAKPDGSSRLVTDFKSITSYCRPTPSLLPDVESTIRRLASFKYLIKADMSESYYQLEMHKDSKKYCGVHTPYKGVLVYNVGSMGLPGVEVALEELTCLILGDMVKDGRVCKLADDLFIGGDSPKTLLENFHTVLHKLHENNIKLKPSKTVIAPKTVNILGWVWTEGKLKASPHKLSALSSCQPPKTISALRSYLGSYRFISRTIKGHANILAPLEEIVKGKQPKDTIVWTETLTDAFDKAKAALKESKTITIPNKNDTLSIVTDASVRPGAVGATLFVIRNEKPLLAGFYNSKLPEYQRRWLPCEVEALAIALALHHFAPYIIQSSEKPQILTDSKPCVDAVNKLNKGHFSTSARLSTFLSSVSRYNAIISHIPGSMNVISDYASRHPLECNSPTECSICKFVAETMNSVISYVTVEDIISGKANMPWTNRKTWGELQDQCDILRKVKFFSSNGTNPNKKSKNMRPVRRHLSAGVILSHDNVLINPVTSPLGPVRERIVVPEKIIHGLVNIMHLRLNHPSAFQLNKAFDRYFFSLNSNSIIKEVCNNCSQCASIREVPSALIQESTEPPPSVVGGKFSADIIKRCSQKIFCIRETVTSYTLAEIIPNETAESVSNAIERLCNLLRPSTASQITIRVDPASAHQSLFKSLKCHNNLALKNINLELGRILNKNKNPIIDRAIRELHREIIILQPSGGQISQNLLSQAVANLNCRYRNTGLSSQELWTQRDQITNQQLPISDREVIIQQHEKRLNNHKHSENSKSHGKPPHPTAKVKIGSLVFVYNDREKTSARDRYMVTKIDGNNVKLRKFTNKYFGIKEYDAKLQEIYPVPSIESVELQDDIYSESSDDEYYNSQAPNLFKRNDTSQSNSSYSEGSDEDSDSYNNPIVTQEYTPKSPVKLRDRGLINKPQRYGQWTT